jgi:Flp pilus assembly protein TadD
MVSYLDYLGKMIWPEKLGMFYPHPGNTLTVWEGILCGMVLMSITIISIRLIRKAPYFVVGWFWYLGTLLPVIGIVQVGGQSMADRYTYVPLIGIFIIIAWGVPELISKWHFKEKVLSVSAGIIIFALMITTWEQVSHWKNSITLFKHAIRIADKKYPNLAIIHNNLGTALFDNRKIEEAISHYKTAIKLNPNYTADIKYPNLAITHYNLGIALFADRKNGEAISHYKTAIKFNPKYTKAYFELGIALFADRKIEEAISSFKMAINLRPNFTKAHYNLGIALFAGRKIEEAISHYKMAIKLNPNYTKAHYNLGYALLQKGRMKEAVHHFRKTLKLRPDHVAAQKNLKTALLLSEEIE